MEAFVYCWTDHGTNKLYIGAHKGTPDDGYICSSKVMSEECTKRPNDFTRQILAHGSWPEMFVFEQAIIKGARAHRDPGFYNQALSVGPFYTKGPRSEATKIKLSQITKKQFENQENRDDARDRTIQQFENPLARQKTGTISKERWASMDPKKRQVLKEARARKTKEHWATMTTEQRKNRTLNANQARWKNDNHNRIC